MLHPETRCSLAAASGSLLLGYDTGVIAGALLLIIPEYSLEDRPELVGLVVSSCAVGALVGTLLSGPAADAFGRRCQCVLACLLALLGMSCMQTIPDTPKPEQATPHRRRRPIHSRRRCHGG